MSYADKSCGNLTDTDKALFAATVAASGGIGSGDVAYKNCSEVVEAAPGSRLRGRRLADTSQSPQLLDIVVAIRITMAGTSSREDSDTLNFLAKQLQRHFADSMQRSLDTGLFLTALSQAYANATGTGVGSNATGLLSSLFSVSTDFSVSEAVVEIPPTASPTVTPTAHPSAAPTTPSKKSTSSSLSGGALAGIVIGGTVLFGLVVVWLRLRFCADGGSKRDVSVYASE
jgi:hypothetical protein